MVCVLVHEHDDGTLVGSHKTSSVNHLKFSHLMVINASDIDTMHVLSNDDSIITKDTAIGSPVNKRTTIHLGRMDIGDSIAMYVHLDRRSMISSSGGHDRSGLI